MDWLAERFAERRADLVSVARRMLGPRPASDQAVQDAWARVAGSHPQAAETLSWWLTTMVVRACLDTLLAGRPGALCPPRLRVMEAAPQAGPDAPLADSVGLALVVVLDTLPPSARLAFILHDLFGLSFEEIAPMIGRSAPVAEQLAGRARRRLRGG